MTLVRAIDSAQPYLPPPAGTKIILGYLGGREASVTWTREQVDEARKYAWFAPIWVPAQGVVFDPVIESQNFETALTAYGVPKGSPVFIDIERDTWYDGDQLRPGIRDAANLLLGALRNYGWPAYAYAPAGLGAWLASWELPVGQVPKAPTALLPGLVGWQYACAGATSYDLSVFTDALDWWGKPKPTPTPTPKPAPQPEEDDDMPYLVHATEDSTTQTGNIHKTPLVKAGDVVLVYTNGKVVHVPHPADVTPLKAIFGELREVSGQFIANHIEQSL